MAPLVLLSTATGTVVVTSDPRPGVDDRLHCPTFLTSLDRAHVSNEAPQALALDDARP